MPGNPTYPLHLLHLRFLPGAPGFGPEALFGFSLPLLPDLTTLRGLTGIAEAARLQEALERQRLLTGNLWTSGVTSVDLRLVGDSARPGVGVGVLCRVRRPAHVPESAFPQHCMAVAEGVRQSFAAAGYDLEPLTSDTAVVRYLAPFNAAHLAEIRRHEELFVAEDAYTEYEFYVAYPWPWNTQPRARLLEALTQRQGDCLVSICIEPTQVTPQEQAHLTHAVSPQVSNLLRGVGPRGQLVERVYHELSASLRRPYLVRLMVAATSPHMLQTVAQTLLDDLHAGQAPGTGAVVESPRGPREWQGAHTALYNAAWYPWGTNRGADLPGTARLRYLMSDAEASAVFRIPVPATLLGAARPATPHLMRVLVIFASPQDGQQLNLSQEEEEIHAAIARSVQHQRIQVVPRRGATVHDLRRALGEQGPFQILHVSTHGSASGLILEGDTGTGRFVPIQGVAALLKLYVPPLQCVVLNACDSLSQGRYLQDVVPYTIAMEGPLGDRAALEFSRGFYDAIGRGETIERAYEEGRVNVQLTYPNSPFQPVLLKRV